MTGVGGLAAEKEGGSDPPSLFIPIGPSEAKEMLIFRQSEN